MARSNKDHKCDLTNMFCCKKSMCLIGLVMLGLSWVATKVFWDWIMPDVFPSGIIAGTISWYTAFKIAFVCTGLMILKKKWKYKMMMHMKMK